MPSLGIPQSAKQLLALPKTTDVLVNTDLIIPIAASQSFIGKAFLPITLAGAASGAKVQVTVPAGGTAYLLGYEIINGNSATVAAADVILASAAFSNALANATDHFIKFDLTVVNGATAGNITVQFAQLTTDAAAATLLAGAFITGTLL
jgi:hypothetical protein